MIYGSKTRPLLADAGLKFVSQWGERSPLERTVLGSNPDLTRHIQCTVD